MAFGVIVVGWTFTALSILELTNALQLYATLKYGKSLVGFGVLFSQVTDIERFTMNLLLNGCPPSFTLSHFRLRTLFTSFKRIMDFLYEGKRSVLCNSLRREKFEGPTTYIRMSLYLGYRCLCRDL